MGNPPRNADSRHPLIYPSIRIDVVHNQQQDFASINAATPPYYTQRPHRKLKKLDMYTGLTIGLSERLYKIAHFAPEITLPPPHLITPSMFNAAADFSHAHGSRSRFPDIRPNSSTAGGGGDTSGIKRSDL